MSCLSRFHLLWSEQDLHNFFWLALALVRSPLSSSVRSRLNLNRSGQKARNTTQQKIQRQDRNWETHQNAMDCVGTSLRNFALPKGKWPEIKKRCWTQKVLKYRFFTRLYTKVPSFCLRLYRKDVLCGIVRFRLRLFPWVSLPSVAASGWADCDGAAGVSGNSQPLSLVGQPRLLASFFSCCRSSSGWGAYLQAGNEWCNDYRIVCLLCPSPIPNGASHYLT